MHEGISDLRAAFERHGFVHVPGFLPQHELAAVLSNLKRYVSDVLPGLDVYRALYDTSGGERTIKQMVDMQQADSFFADLLRSDKAQSLARALLGEAVIPQSIEYFDKGPGMGNATPAHQDGFYFCLKPNHAVTLWIGLDDFDRENGCMSYITGSHQRGLIQHQASGVVGFSQGISDAGYDAGRQYLAAGNAGDCYAHHSLTIHLAGANASERHRRSLGLIYYAASARPDEEASARYRASVAAQRQKYAREAVNA